jgi:Fe-S cluster assembly iron-binding protein IscA
VNADDYVLQRDNKTVFAVDSETLSLIEGSTIDYEDKMVRSAFFVHSLPYI